MVEISLYRIVVRLETILWSQQEVLTPYQGKREKQGERYKDEEDGK